MKSLTVSTSAVRIAASITWIKKAARILAITTSASLAIATLTNVALGDDLVADFSIGSNPNGNWSYGWSETLGGTFNLDPTSTSSHLGTGLSGWESGLGGEGNPWVLYNGTGSPASVAPTEAIQPGQLALNPKESFYAVVR